MARRAIALVLGGLVLAGCSTSSTQATSSTTAAKTSTTTGHVGEVYAKRYCEVLLVDPTAAGGPQADVYNSFPMTACPPAQWRALDATALAKDHGVPVALLNGPRYWAMDSIAKVRTGATVRTTFGGIPMDKEATVAIGDLAAARTPYVAHSVDRKASVTYATGRQIHELTDPHGAVYVMQSWSQQIDPTLGATDLATLGLRLTVPQGWTYTSRTLTTPLVVQTTGQVAHVLMDALGNSYSLEAAR